MTELSDELHESPSYVQSYVAKTMAIALPAYMALGIVGYVVLGSQVSYSHFTSSLQVKVKLQLLVFIFIFTHFPSYILTYRLQNLQIFFLQIIVYLVH